MRARLRKMLAFRGDRRRLAAEARQWTTSDAFNVALMHTRDEVVRQWAAASTPAEREQCWHTYHALQTIPTALQGLIDDNLVETRRGT